MVARAIQGFRLMGTNMKTSTLHMIGNAHIDPVWLWRWQEGCHEVLATFRSALDRLSEEPDFLFVSSSAAFYAWVEQINPAMFEEIRARVQEGRWEIVGGWWIQPDCNIPCGESFVRQALYGQRYFKAKFGVTARVGYNVDSFGHHAMLPQILRKSGLESYVFMRPGPHEKGLPARLFWWESDDGSRVLAYRLPFEYCTWGRELDVHIQRCAGELRAPFNELMCFYGVGNHGGGPTIANIQSIRRLDEDPHMPRLRFSTPNRFFDSIRAQDLPIPTVHDELQHHASGCYAAHSGIKRANRQAEWALLTAERMAAIAAHTTGLPYPRAEFERAWQGVLFNQFHDILAGTSLESAYTDAGYLYGEAMAIAERATNAATQSLAWKIAIAQEDGVQPIVVFNPHPWASRAPVELEMNRIGEGHRLLDEQGQAVPMQLVQSEALTRWRRRPCFLADLPPLGWRVYRMVAPSEQAAQPAPEAPGSLEVGGQTIENAHLRLTIAASGAIESLYDMQAGLEALAGPGALPVVLADPSDTWSHDVFAFDQEIGRFEVEQVQVTEYGPVRATVRVTSRYGSSRLVQDFSLYAGLDYVDVSATVDWHEQHRALKLRFPINVFFQRITHEIPYGVIERFANGEEEPGQSWLDVSGSSPDTGGRYGVSIMNDGKYSSDVRVRDVGLTVLRSPIYAHHDPAVPDPQTTYQFIDQGQQRFRYRLLPHREGWEQAGTVRRAAELNQAPIAMIGTFHPDGTLAPMVSFVHVDTLQVEVSALKLAEDGDDLVLRAYETTRASGRATITLPHWQRTITADFGPSEIKTFRIPRDPAATVVEVNLIEE
jgi:alpha-mannosidase